MNGKTFVFFFLTSAFLFAGALYWSVKTRPAFELTRHSSEELSGDFIAHISMGFAKKDIQLVQLNQVEIVEPQDFGPLLAEFPFLEKAKSLRVPVIYNFFVPVNDKIYLKKVDNTKLELTVGELMSNEPILQLKDFRVELKKDLSAKISNSEIQNLIQALKPMMKLRGEKRKLESSTAALTELKTQLSSWIRIKNLNPKPEISVHILDK